MASEDKDDECPRRPDHTPGPKGYLEWHAWAERQAATNVQVPCPGGCGSMVWTPADDLCGRCQHPTEHHEGPGAPCYIADCSCTRWTRRRIAKAEHLSVPGSSGEGRHG